MFLCSQLVRFIPCVYGSHIPGGYPSALSSRGVLPVTCACVPRILQLFLTGGSTGLFGSTAVVLRAARGYEAGEEFLVSYGPKGAAGYLEENGYALS